MHLNKIIKLEEVLVVWFFLLIGLNVTFSLYDNAQHPDSMLQSQKPKYNSIYIWHWQPFNR